MIFTISIEFLIFLLFIFVITAWAIWNKISKKIALKKYKPENDKARLAEESRRSGISKGRIGTTEKANTGISGYAEPPKQDLFPTTDVNVDGKTSNSTGEDGRTNRRTGRISRNPFRRRKE